MASHRYFLSQSLCHQTPKDTIHQQICRGGRKKNINCALGDTHLTPVQNKSCLLLCYLLLFWRQWTFTTIAVSVSKVTWRQTKSAPIVWNQKQTEQRESKCFYTKGCVRYAFTIWGVWKFNTLRQGWMEAVILRSWQVNAYHTSLLCHCLPLFSTSKNSLRTFIW